jgi:hypothetical protein
MTGMTGMTGIGIAVSGIVTANFNAAVNGIYLADTTAVGAFTAALPSSAVAGDRIVFLDAKKSFASANLTVDRNGLNINGAAANYVCDVNGDKIEFLYVDAAYGWSTFALGV